jgi:hypothetical protein
MLLPALSATTTTLSNSNTAAAAAAVSTTDPSTSSLGDSNSDSNSNPLEELWNGFAKSTAMMAMVAMSGQQQQQRQAEEEAAAEAEAEAARAKEEQQLLAYRGRTQDLASKPLLATKLIGATVRKGQTNQEEEGGKDRKKIHTQRFVVSVRVMSVYFVL